MTENKIMWNFKKDSIKTIVVPTDFSKVAHNAYLFAREMADLFQYNIKVVHIYGGELNAMEHLALQSGDTPFNY